MSKYGHGGPGEANFWARMAKTPEGQAAKAAKAAKAANNARRTAAAASAKNKNKSGKTYHSSSFGKHYGGSRSRKTRRSTRRNRRR